MLRSADLGRVHGGGTDRPHGLRRCPAAGSGSRTPAAIVPTWHADVFTTATPFTVSLYHTLQHFPHDLDSAARCPRVPDHIISMVRLLHVPKALHPAERHCATRADAHRREALRLLDVPALCKGWPPLRRVLCVVSRHLREVAGARALTNVDGGQVLARSPDDGSVGDDGRATDQGTGNRIPVLFQMVERCVVVVLWCCVDGSTRTGMSVST